MLKITSESCAGYGENQDALVIMPHPKKPSLLLMAIADGQGGQPGGKAAAQMACNMIVAEASKCKPWRLLWTKKWTALMKRTDRAIRDNADAGFTTLIAFAVMGKRMCGTACGDSGLMAIVPHDIKILSKGQMKNPPIGSGQACGFDFCYALPPPYIILAMTDGVWKFASWDIVREKALEIRDPQEMIASIRNAAKTSGSLQDDFTLVVLKEDGEQ
jgi:serine/threonine protein phosphatase PrpC